MVEKKERKKDGKMNMRKDSRIIIGLNKGISEKRKIAIEVFVAPSGGRRKEMKLRNRVVLRELRDR